MSTDQLHRRFRELDDRATSLVDAGRIFEAIEELTAANRIASDPRIESRLVHLRHEAFASIPDQDPPDQWPRDVPDMFSNPGVPVVDRDALTPAVLASAVTNHGSLHVRGLFDAEATSRMIATIDEAFRACDARQYVEADVWPGTWFMTFHPSPGYPPPENFHRAWVRSAGGVLAADSPPAFFIMTELFEQVGLREIVSAYLGEQPVMAVDKVTLRRVPLDLAVGEWHQDGAFLGDGIRSLNVWLALTDCGEGEAAPGMDLIPRRIGSLLPRGSEGAYFPWSIGHDVVARAAGDTPIVRPTFRAGDALLFDDLLVHRTALDPTHTRERYAIESWFFAASSYPEGSTPVVF